MYWSEKCQQIDLGFHRFACPVVLPNVLGGSDFLILLYFLLAHLSYYAHRWAYSIDRVRRLSSTLFEHLLRNRWANRSQILYGSSMGRRYESLFEGLGHMTKMAATPIHGKHPLKIFFSGTKGPKTLGLGMQHLGRRPNKVFSNDDLRLTLTFFMARSNLLSYAFIWRNTHFFRKNVRKSFNGRNL